MSGFQDPSLIPGTDVLRNKAGIEDFDKLRRFEYFSTALRQADAPTFPVTAQGFKDTHKHLFGDVYDWAGQSREVGISKGGFEYVRASMVEASLESRFQQLQGNGNLQNLSADRFAAGAAEHLAEVNRIHAFREGNGRTMRLHLDQLAAQAGHKIDSTTIPKEEWDRGFIRALEGSKSDLTRAIAGVLTPAERVSIETAIGRTRELHPQAIEDVRDRTKEISDLMRAGKGSTITSMELGRLRDEMTAIGSPDNNPALIRLQRLRDAGATELTILTGQATSARDQLHALREGADRALRAPVQASAVTDDLAPGKAAAASATVAPAPKQSASSYWNSIASTGKQQGADDAAPSADRVRGPRR